MFAWLNFISVGFSKLSCLDLWYFGANNHEIFIAVNRMTVFIQVSLLSLSRWCLRFTCCWQALMLPSEEVVLPFLCPGCLLLALCHLPPAAYANICIAIQFRDVMDAETNLPKQQKRLMFNPDRCFVLLHCSC